MTLCFEAVIFDMDGLLLDTERVALETYLATASDLGIETTTEFFRKFIGRPWDATKTLIREKLGPQDSERILALWPETYEARVRSGGIPKKTGVDDLLDMLRRHQIPVALATSTARPLALNQLRPVGLIDHFEAMVTGDEVTRGKPSPDIFLLAARRLGVAPPACLVLEDSEPGVEAAAAAGMHVIMVPDLVSPTARIAETAAHICANLIEVRRLLEGVLSA